jgi:predicted metalloprotease with PDZ domain
LVLRHKGGNVHFGYPNLIEQLSKKYGPNRPFSDDSLFTVIRALGHAHAADFLEKHVAGTNPLPLKEIFDWVGVDFRNRDTLMVRDLGFDVKRLLFDGSAQAYYVSSSSDVTEVGRKAGIKEGTYILEVGGILLRNKEDLERLKKERLSFATDKPLDIRLGKQKKSVMKSKQKTLKPGVVSWISGIEFVRRSNPSPAQETLWNAWLNL